MRKGVRDNIEDDKRPKGCITDGFGNYWKKKCPECGGKMEVVRPGKAQCERCG